MTMAIARPRRLERVLTKEGHRVSTASRVRDALHLAERDGFDLVICCARLPPRFSRFFI